MYNNHKTIDSMALDYIYVRPHDLCVLKHSVEKIIRMPMQKATPHNSRKKQ